MPKPSLTIGARAWLLRRLAIRAQPFNSIEAFGLPLMDSPEKQSPPVLPTGGE